MILPLAALVYFDKGFDALFEAWQLPEYSHGPLIPILSALLFLRQLKSLPERPGFICDRWQGVAVIFLAIVIGGLGRLINIDDIVAYALIFWVGGILLISFGWKTGKHFWPPVLHLVYMLPLPSVLYFELSTFLQFISSELGVWLLRLISVPVFLEGNIIDLGVIKLHVAEACSGLRYLFPILSFSYIFAVLYRGPKWHKAVLLIAAAPITVLMNSVRIAMAGYIVNNFGINWLEGFSHFFEGWVIFVICVLMLFGLARVMLLFHPDRPKLTEALDLDTEGLATQALRIRLVQPSRALITAVIFTVGGSILWSVVPERSIVTVEREPFALFPSKLGDWASGQRQKLDSDIANILGADDYHLAPFQNIATGDRVDIFIAWYADQSSGGIHSPEVCLPAGGWEIADLQKIDVTGQFPVDGLFTLNRAIIQKGADRMMVYYWFEQQGNRTASSYLAKFYLMWAKITTRRQDSALVRLTTVIEKNENNLAAEERLKMMVQKILTPLPRFVPGS